MTRRHDHYTMSTWRRLQHLCCVGWHPYDVAAYLGLPEEAPQAMLRACLSGQSRKHASIGANTWANMMAMPQPGAEARHLATAHGWDIKGLSDVERAIRAYAEHGHLSVARDMAPRLDMSPRQVRDVLRRHKWGRYQPVELATRRSEVVATLAVRMITHDGRTQTAQQWADEQGLKLYTVSDRLSNGWPLDEAIGFAPHTPTRLVYAEAA